MEKEQRLEMALRILKIFEDAGMSVSEAEVFIQEDLLVALGSFRVVAAFAMMTQQEGSAT